jgi:ABC-type dipeptide/oligopeptide/nickel transport system permease subunit
MTTVGADVALEAVSATGSRAGVLRRTFARPQAWLGAGVLTLLIGWALLGPLLAPWGATTSDVLAFGRPPSPRHWFGTNDIGQDLYAQVLAGLRKSLVVGLVAGPGATAIAGVVGAVAGYLGGVVDRGIVWFVDLLLAVPAFYLLALASPLFARVGWPATVLVIALLSWMVMARVVRAQTMSLRDRDFVRAARFMGVPVAAVIRRHILPNVASLLVIDAALGVGAAILTESTLSFVGLGVQPPDVSLGTLLAAGSPAAATRPWLFLFPAGVLIVAVLATSLLGDALRDAVDPTSGSARG